MDIRLTSNVVTLSCFLKRVSRCLYCCTAQTSEVERSSCWRPAAVQICGLLVSTDTRVEDLRLDPRSSLQFVHH